MADYEQMEEDLETAANKIFASGIRSYWINGRNVMFNSPAEILEALRKVRADKAPGSGESRTTYAEVED
jgi:hypothetical protein